MNDHDTPARRLRRWAAAAAMGLALGAAAASPAAADVSTGGFSPPDITIEDEGEELDAFGTTLATGDFNGDGYDDSAVGVPLETVDGKRYAGAVNVIYGSAGGLSAAVVPDQFWSQDSPDIQDDAEAADRFGSALAAGDFNGDGRDDLAIGVPLEDQSLTIFTADAGAVNVIYGSPAGLSATYVPNVFLQQGFYGVQDPAEPGDHFGASLAAGRFNLDGYDDLAVGVPEENVGGKQLAGAVNVIYGAAGGLSSSQVPVPFLRQGFDGLEGMVSSFDHFGSSLAVGRLNGDDYDDLAIGVPGEGVGGKSSAGAVSVIYGSSTGLSATLVPDQLWHQNSADIPEAAEQDDQFGLRLAIGDFDRNADKSTAHYDDLAIGVPLEDDVNRANAGVVQVIYGAAGGLSATQVPAQLWQQGADGITGFGHASDAFGDQLAAGSFNGDSFDDLAISVPNDDIILGLPDGGAGAVRVIYGYAGGLSAKQVPAQYWDQDVPDVLDQRDSRDRFGHALATGRFNGDVYDDLAIGVPGEDVGTVSDMGAMNVIHGTGGGLSATVLFNQFWHQDS